MQRLGCRDGVDILRLLRPRRQHRDHVGPHLRESAIDEKSPYFRTVPRSQLARTETADQRRPTGQHAEFAVEHWQDDGIDGRVEDRSFRRDHHALHPSRRAILYHRLFPFLQVLGLLRRFFDGADIKEGTLGQVIVLAVA